ncbi:type II toxin-antitoxin system HipA family toxin [Pontiellaceae bacterium B12227]|nr:type II toxin-antitoxin system HipA family toxin [Pontiellaceae bacterium B12227]
MKTLTLYFHGEQAGSLTQDAQGQYAFQYAQDWLSSSRAHPISQSLPLREAQFEERECVGFFGGLLPEDYNRELIARNIGVTAQNDYAMLKVIGGECAGAITLLDPEVDPVVQQHAYHPVSDQELETILNTLPRKPLLAGEAEIRLSLAGAQNKLAVYHDDRGFALPLHESPSTHILKPEAEAFPGLAENEAYCLRLARAAGLPCADAKAITIGPHRGLLVRRYDRTGEGEQLHRLHQEDFCQAMGIPSRYKYQAEGGPSLKQCFDLIRIASSRPAKDLITLFEAVVFNYLIGNNDAHGKNFSLLYVPSGKSIQVQLAPFYDLVSTAAYPDLSPKMAMKIGSKYNPSDPRLRHWETFWESVGFSTAQSKKQTLRFLDRINQVLTDSAQSQMEQTIHDIIDTRHSALTRLLMS